MNSLLINLFIGQHLLSVLLLHLLIMMLDLLYYVLFIIFECLLRVRVTYV